MSEISTDNIKLSNDWGVTFGDYVYNDKKFDFQDLTVAVSMRRATAVEGEVQPISTRIQERNKTLEELGDALSDLTKLQAQFDSEAEGDDRQGSLQGSSYDTLVKVFGSVDFDNLQMTKYEVEEWLQKVKSKIDGLNNDSQLDMTRLESLVDRRDEAYSTASDLMSEISDTRSSLVRNL